MMGKLLLFRAEARLGLESASERLLAAQEITRAETIFAQGRGDPDCKYWLRQIPTRVKAAFEVGTAIPEPRGQVTIRYPLSYAAGILTGIVLLAVLYVATDKAVPLPPPSPKDLKGQEAKKVSSTSADVTKPSPPITSAPTPSATAKQGHMTPSAPNKAQVK